MGVRVRHFSIVPIEHSAAMEVIVRDHYLHRTAPCSYAFGLFDADILVGVICYGTPSSAPLRGGICGKEEASNVIELTRLWVSDECPKNSESYLIGNTIRRIDKEIVVSFADPAAGHVGIVYQATNWIYTGLSAKRTDWTVDGIAKHGQTLADKYTASEIREKYGDRFCLRARPRKHRYVFFNCDRRRKRELMRKLRYQPVPYPKMNQEE
jgi:hypothetical protein